MFFKRSKKVEVYQEQPFERAIASLNESKYGIVDEGEFEFIKLLFHLFELNNLHGYLKISRMSSNALTMDYNGYPIGKVKLKGRKKSFMFSSNINAHHSLDIYAKDDYELFIGLWIRYIRRILKVT